MKKLLFKTLTLLLILSISIGVNAQISIGPKLGVNIANIGGDDQDDDEAKSLTGIQAGIVAEIGITEKFSFQPEILYFQKGYSADDDVKLTLNYLEIPLLAKIKFGDGGSTSFFATAGPSFGFGQKIKISADGDSQTFDFDDEFFELKKLDISLSLGLGAQFPIGAGNLFTDVRYLLGLTSLDDSGSDLDVKNRGIGIAVGYLFPL